MIFVILWTIIFPREFSVLHVSLDDFFSVQLLCELNIIFCMLNNIETKGKESVPFKFKLHVVSNGGRFKPVVLK